jgi:hypothetical protein
MMARNLLLILTLAVALIALGCGEHHQPADTGETHTHADGTVHAGAEHGEGETHTHADGTVHAGAEHGEGATHTHTDETVHTGTEHGEGATHTHTDETVHTGAEHGEGATHTHADGTVHAGTEHGEGATHTHADGTVHTGAEHGHDAHGEAEQLSLHDTYDETEQGIRLLLSYDQVSASFIGTIENVSDSTISNIRVTVRLSNGGKLGIREQLSLAAGQRAKIELATGGQSFDWWRAQIATE